MRYGRFIREAVSEGAMRCAVTRGVSVRAATVDAEARTVEAVLSTESRVLVRDWEQWRVIEEILVSDGMQLPGTRQVPLLADHRSHNLSAVHGSVRDVRASEGTVRGVLHFAREGGEETERHWGLMREGHLTDVSVGYRPVRGKYVDIAPGESAEVNGRKYTAGPEHVLRVTTAWELQEVSLVPIGADAMAKIRAAAEQGDAGGGAPEHKERAMNEAVRKFLVACGMRANTTEPEANAYYNALGGERAELAAQVMAGTLTADAAITQLAGARADADPAAADNGVDLDAVRAQAREAATRAERERVAALRGYESVAGPEAVAQAIADGLSVDAARGRFLDSLASERNAGGDVAPGVAVTRDAGETTLRALSEAVAVRAGATAPAVDSLPTAQREAAEAVREQARTEFQGLTLLETCREICLLHGQSHRGSAGEVFNRAVSTGALASVFATTINRHLMEAYGLAPDTTSAWVDTEDVTDFKTHTEVRFRENGQLEEVAAGTEAVQGSFEDSTETYRAYRYGKQYLIDEQHVINDDLGALQRIPRMAGLQAGQLRGLLVYSTLLGNPTMGDNVALFHTSSHRNYLAGAAGALDSDALAAGRVKMRNQYEGSGKNKRVLNVTPSTILVPPELEDTAYTLLNSQTVLGQTDKLPSLNPARRYNMQVVAEPLIGSVGVYNPRTKQVVSGSTTGWYMFANPMLFPVMRLVFLAGTGRMPQVRVSDVTQGRWGTHVDVKYDVGCAAVGWHGAYHANGTD